MPISPPLVSKLAQASAIANSTDGQTIYVAYGNRLLRTTNGGGDGTLANWQTMKFVNGIITTIAVHPETSTKVYLATDAGEIWQTLDGTTWTDISGNFPALKINSIALKTETGSPVTWIFLGTSVGVYASSSETGSVDWQPFGTGLPDVAVTDLHYNPRTKYLVAATYGRGVFAAYLHFMTRVALGATSLGQQLFVFGADNSGEIQVNQATLGQAFSGWFDVQGKGHTDAAPASTTVGNSIFVFVKGLGGDVFLNQAEFEHPFSGWFEVQGNGRTDRAPSATTLNKTVFVFVKGLDNRIYLNQADFGHAFGNWFEVQGGQLTDEAPAATALGQSIFVFVRGLDGRVYVNQAEFGHAFSDWFEVQGGGLTDQAPAVTTVGKTVFVFIKGLDGRIYANQAEFGHAFSGWFEVGGGMQ